MATGMTWSWAALAGALIATALGQGFFKLFFRSSTWRHLALGLCLFAAAPLCNYVALRQLAIDTVYMSTAITQLLVLGFSTSVLKEKLTRDHGIAMALILSGIIVYNL